MSTKSTNQNPERSGNRGGCQERAVWTVIAHEIDNIRSSATNAQRVVSSSTTIGLTT